MTVANTEFTSNLRRNRIKETLCIYFCVLHYARFLSFSGSVAKIILNFYSKSKNIFTNKIPWDILVDSAFTFINTISGFYMALSNAILYTYLFFLFAYSDYEFVTTLSFFLSVEYVTH